MSVSERAVETPARMPQAWSWYVAYCLAMAAMYFVVAALGVVFLALDPADLEMESLEARVQGVVLLVMGLALCVPFAVAPLLPRRSWVWVYGIVLIAVGLTSCCCMPASIPLLIAWMKPEMKQAFGRP